MEPGSRVSPALSRRQMASASPLPFAQKKPVTGPAFNKGARVKGV
ncbi:MAG: hypothetical protein HoeaKO_12850 [Hoeflea alexandrii]